jgi:Domain of unknown function (DUF4277)
MQALSPALAVYPGHPLPLLKAYADRLGLVSLLTHSVPTAMGVDAGTVVLAMGWDTLRGRRPLSRLEACFAQHDTALLLGKAVPPQALHAETAGRVLDRLSDFGTMRLFTAWAVRAVRRCGVERRSGHFATTSRRVWGDSQWAETPDRPWPMTSGESQDKRPALPPLVLSTLCVEPAVPIWGTPADGKAAEKTRHRTLWSEIAQLLTQYGVQPGASISMAAAARVPEDPLAALGDPWCITRLPATYSAWGRGMAEAVAHNPWEEVGVLTQTPPPKHRPGTC